MTKKFIRSGQARLRVQDEGDGPAVALLHAGVADLRMWSGQVKMLARLPKVASSCFEGCAHLTPLERPQLFNEIMGAFLAG
ncbi:MAG: pimeloyl-ACP methyl ester carboxylesterase [Candidatus Paceibacteria bacterium]|jgi:pimeloyl-ACP methyl ester carboxylesterase